jgi:hypothetical protein
MLSLVPNIILRNLYKKSPNVARMSFTMTAARCLYISCVHDSTLLWDPFDVLTTSHHVLSVCARAFTEIDHDGTMNMNDMQYATPQPWHFLIPWSPDHVIFHPSHLVILVLHIHTIIPMKVPCQSLEPIVRNPHIHSSLPCGFSPIIPSIISLSFYKSSLPWFYLENIKGKLRNIWKILLVQLTPIHSKFDPISIRNLPLNSMK